MFKKVSVSLVLPILLYAGIFDFMTLKKAEEAYAGGKYKEAAKLYSKIAKEGSDEARFNAGDALYKAGDYRGALKMYESVTSPELKFEKLHNMGNCYAKLGEIGKGIEAYKEALKIREDSDTRFNLELLEKMKRQKERREREKKGRSEQKNGRQKQNGGSAGKERKESFRSGAKERKEEQKSGKGEEERKEGQKGEREKKESDRNGKNGKEERKSQNGEKKSTENGQKREKRSARPGEAEMRKEPISDMELRKWNKELNRRRIQTLMLPLETKETKGGENEKNPW
ncbi:TPR domain protein in aerotolerance operon [Hydrogenimonas sp.]|nr:TPR domain protein in aerotolerance operon [Hydrogenimonas sp.]